ncbi:MAG TPA: Crp/Fnr family transcriptional regulator [Actinoplanes sp.]|nr:Crp/Fnr family transcriptional regulator [Actinoplanes sp.]
MINATGGQEAAKSCVSLVPLFSGLTAGQQAEVAKLARPRQVGRGEYVFRAGEPAATLYVVHAGRVRISRLSAGGQERVLRILGPGEVVGESAFLTGRPPENDATAVENTRMCVFDHGRLADLVRTFPDIAVAMLRAVSARLASTERMLAAMTGADITGRVAAYLLDCEVARGDGGRVRVQLPAFKKDIASFLGTTPETLSRTLAGLAREKVIVLSGHAQVEILDMPRLELLSAGV